MQLVFYPGKASLIDIPEFNRITIALIKTIVIRITIVIRKTRDFSKKPSLIVKSDYFPDLYRFIEKIEMFRYNSD